MMDKTTSPHLVNIWHIITNLSSLCSVNQALLWECNFSLLVPASTKLAHYLFWGWPALLARQINSRMNNMFKSASFGKTMLTIWNYALRIVIGVFNTMVPLLQRNVSDIDRIRYIFHLIVTLANVGSSYIESVTCIIMWPWQSISDDALSSNM